MKVLLTAINSKYIHSNLAVYTLKAYAKKYEDNIELAEYTINNLEDYILKEIYKKKPDIIAFSCYIWNIEMITNLIDDIAKVMPDTVIWLGGPEVSYDSVKTLTELPMVRGIMNGEGEMVFNNLMRHYIDGDIELRDIKGLTYYEDDKIVTTGFEEQMKMSDIPFVYENLEDFENKIIYYESSRGCPFSCSYCLSSIDKKVRFRDLELVKKELKFFLDNNVRQVKFVDRTFNCKKDHAMAIWRFIRDNDNGITNFHFEISADIITQEELDLIKTMRKGLIQLEIGVQSTNDATIKEIHRTMKFDEVSRIVKTINSYENVHQHLDLIAGLPYEDYNIFAKSFDDVYALCPEQLQLGFLKVLKGSYMYENAKSYGVRYKNKPPYEVLSTKWLPYSDVLRLKNIEDMVEVYYNSGQFTYSMRYLVPFFGSAFKTYERMAEYYEEEDLFAVSHNRMARYNILLDFAKKNTDADMDIFAEILVYDMYMRENVKSRPDFARDMSPYKAQITDIYLKERETMEHLRDYAEYNVRYVNKMTHIEVFTRDIKKYVCEGIDDKKETFVLFDYQNRDPLTYEALSYIVS